jgi:uncharacterized protein YecE (DUF72 family)
VTFLDMLPPDRCCAFEFRHPSWSAARPLLESRGVACCFADTDDEPAPEDALASGPFHYLRLRRARYSPAQLARWAERIRRALAAGRDAFVFFKHEEAGTGPRYAQQLTKLGVSSSNRRRPGRAR